MIRIVLLALRVAAMVPCLSPTLVLAASLAATREPILRIEPGGPNCFVSSLAFSPDGKTLYAAGWDKIVYVWRQDGPQAPFVLDRPATCRVPLGPGLHGALNSIAVSPDGSLVAAAGQGLVGVAADFRQLGLEVPEAGGLDAEDLKRQGTIYVFDNRRRTVRALAGHMGPVVALAFAPAAAAKPPLLISAARERDMSQGRRVDVVRLWNAATAELLDGARLRESPLEIVRPAIAAWHTGAAAKELQIAIAWGDEHDASLRVWDVQGQKLQAVRDGQYADVALVDEVGNKLLTASVSRLKLWSKAAEPKLLRQLQLPPRQIPRAAALFASRAGGPLDRAAVVVRVLAANADEDHLRLVDLSDFHWLDADIRLWTGRVAPAIAASAGGRRLAISGGSGHDLLAFDVDELLAGRGRGQSLRAPGIAPRFAEFVRRNDRLGLLLSEKSPPGAAFAQRPPADGDLVFDPQAGDIAAPAGWIADAPPAAGWSLSQRAARAPAPPHVEVVLAGPAGTGARMALKPGEEATAFAILPPAAADDIPIVAIASHLQGQPTLHLYNGKTGKPVRWLNAHVERIRSLAFSQDRRFLLSAADDHLLCVWKLDDLDRIIGRRGAIPGVGLESQGDALRVAEVAGDSPPQLAVGDLIQGIIQNGRLRPIATPLDFYMTVSRERPGQTLALSRQTPGGRAEEVKVVLGQAVDERKPLFSYYLAKSDDGSWQWVGWSPLGPFDASRVAAQRLLGWHFNTGNDEQPVRFARADEYRELRYPGLIPYLLSGKPGLPPKPRLPRPDIGLSLEFDGRMEPADDSRVLLRRGRAALLKIAVAGSAAKQIDSVVWRVEGQTAPTSTCRQEPSQLWAADLSELPWTRAAQRLRVIVRTKEREPQVFVEDAVIRGQPLPPRVTMSSPGADRKVVEAPALQLRARVAAAGPEAGPQELVLVQRVGDKEVLRERLTGDLAIDIDRQVELQPGDNTFRIEAVNQGAPAEDKSAETTVFERLVVFRTPREVAPPALALRLVPSDGSRSAVACDTGETIVVDQPTVRLRGKVSAADALAEARWQKNDDAPSAVDGFVPGREKALTVDEEVTLEPGDQVLRVAAKTAHSPRTTARWVVQYRPELPQAFWASPSQDLTLVAGRDAPTIELAGLLQMPRRGAEYPLEIELLNNGRPLPVKPVLDARKRFSAAVAVPPGNSVFQVRLSNRWGSESLSDARRVHYLRPPTIAGVEAPGNAAASLVAVSFRVDSAAELPLEEVRVGARTMPIAAVSIKPDGARANLWTVTVPDVPLAAGTNTLAISVRNPDGWSEAMSVVIVGPPPPPKAEIELRQPVANGVAESPARVQLLVRSRSRLKALSLRAEKQLQTFDVAGQVARGTEGFELSTTADVSLAEGVNQLEVAALNDGGEQRLERQLTYTPSPVTLEIVEAINEQSQEIMRPDSQDGRARNFSKPASEGVIWLKGKVKWRDRALCEQQSVKPLCVTVNSFRQLAKWEGGVEEDHAEWSRSWLSRVRLNLKMNRVEVQVPNDAVDASDERPLMVECRNPNLRQRLHMLVVGVDVDPALRDTLCQHALEAVQGKRDGERVDAPAFSQGNFYKPLVGRCVPRQAIMNQLANIERHVKNNGRDVLHDDPGNDVVLIYFYGPEHVDVKSKQLYLLASGGGASDLDSSAISASELTEYFGQWPGAQVVIMDVERSPQAATPIAVAWTDSARLAALRFVWTKLPKPEDDLLAAIGKSGPRAGRLKDISDAVEEGLPALKSRHLGVVSYDPYLPKSFYDLCLRVRPAN